MPNEEKIELLSEYSKQLGRYFDGSAEDSNANRRYINRNKLAVRSIVIEARAFQTMTISPPPAVGGLVMQNIDPFSSIFNPPYGHSLIPFIRDMIDTAIGAIETGVLDRIPVNEEVPIAEIRQSYAFVAMSIDPDNRELEDVLDTIKQAARDVNIEAERVDEQQANERITDRVLESIRVAEFVIVDLTDAKPNVYYEAGYAQGIGKLPVYLAKHGTQLEFDIRDYPVIFYENMRDLRTGLKDRLLAIADERT